MLSIALLGGLALACVPDSQASATAGSRISAIGATLAPVKAVPVEVQMISEVEEINAGRFNPALAGDLKVETSPASQTLSQIDPNF